MGGDAGWRGEMGRWGRRGRRGRVGGREARAAGWVLVIVGVDVFARASVGKRRSGTAPVRRRRRRRQLRSVWISHGRCNAPLSAIASELGFADDDGVKGVVVSALVLGGALGGLTVGALSDKIGRKAALTWVSAPLVVGTLVSGAATNAATMIVGRFIAGVGVGASSQIVPLYLSEIAPPALRGTLNGFRRLAYVFGVSRRFKSPRR